MSVRFTPKLIEAIEASRLGDDLSSPELAPLSAEMAASPAVERTVRRLHKLDAALGAAFQNVQVPEGLAERIVAAIDSGVVPREEEVVASASGPRKTASGPRKTTRRVLLSVLAASAAVAVVAIAVWPYLGRQQVHDTESILSAAIAFANQDLMVGGVLVSDPAPAIVRQHPISPAIAALGPHRRVQWRAVQNLLERDGVAYDITSAGGIRATLYVVAASDEALNSKPTGRPYPAGNSCATVWREGGLLYVLVVWGDQDAYHRFLAPAQGTGPMA